VLALGDRQTVVGKWRLGRWVGGWVGGLRHIHQLHCTLQLPEVHWQACGPRCVHPTQLTFYWNRVTREVSVRFVRGAADSTLVITNTHLARFPADSLHLVMYGDNANEIIQVFAMDGYFQGEDGAWCPCARGGGAPQVKRERQSVRLRCPLCGLGTPALRSLDV
jgi:hypothetical protein